VRRERERRKRERERERSQRARLFNSRERREVSQKLCRRGGREEEVLYG